MKINNMKLEAVDKTDILNEAVEKINTGSDRFYAESDGEHLIVKWRWKDAVKLGIGSASKEVSEFRYIIILGKDNTFYGYDTDDENTAGGRIQGSAYIRTSSFVGRTIKVHKETAVSKNKGDKNLGINSYDFSAGQMHDFIKKIFTDMGLEYKEPQTAWIKAEGTTKISFLFAGIIFLIIGIFGTLLFTFVGLLQAVFITGLFILLGIWAELISAGILKLPVLSLKAGLFLIIGGIAVSWIFVLIFALSHNI